MPDDAFGQDAASDIDSMGSVSQDFDFDSLDGDGAAHAAETDDLNTGDGAIQADGDIAGSTFGSGNISVEGSTMSESSLTGDVASNDLSVSADHGSSLAFGEGSTAGIDDSDTSVGANYGNFAGEGDLTNEVDNSVHDSGNTSDSFNSSFESDDHSTHESYDIDDSGNTDNSFTDMSSHSDWSSTSDDDYTSDDHSTFESSWSESTSITSDDDFTSDDHSSFDSSWSESHSTTTDTDIDWSDSHSEVSDDDFQDYDGGVDHGLDHDAADFGS
ncbi:MAG TPA: hypothetical protein VIL48_04520 [Acidimicrobiales bacterium]